MNPGRYFIPSYIPNYTIPIRNTGLFQRLFSGIRHINWGGLLNNANKTLNVVNQTIPLIRQAGPMVNNFRSMIHIAKSFNNITKKEVINEKDTIKEPNILKTDSNTTSPNFFL